MSLSLIQSTYGRRLRCVALTAPAIPYRTEAAVSVGTFAVALMVTFCLIALLVAALIFIHRRGWLKLPGNTRISAPTEGIQLQSSRRLSIATTAHVLSYQGNAYLVIESSRGTQAVVTRIEPEESGGALP